MTTSFVQSMRVGLTSIASLALLLSGGTAHGVAYAEDGRHAQAVTLAPMANIYVGQFTELRATTNSGLTVAVTAEGDCRLREMPGSANDIVVATQAGECTVTASQAGDGIWAPAPAVQRTFALLPSEVDVHVVIPGPDRVQPGQPLQVFADITGEEGDDPSPGGAAEFTVRGTSGVVVYTANASLDARGEVAINVPATVTASWPNGAYQIEVAYLGDMGYLPAVAPASFRVGDIGSGGDEPSACYWRDDDGSASPPPAGEVAPGGGSGSGRDENGLTLTITPPVSAQGWDKPTAQITGWEKDVRDVYVTWSVGYTAVPEVVYGSMQDGRVDLPIDTERTQRANVPVGADYTFRVRKWFCTGSLSESLRITPRPQGSLYLEQPYRYTNTVRSQYTAGDGRKNPAIYPSATFRIVTSGHAQPAIQTKSSASGCNLSRTGESDTWFEYYIVAKGWCRVYISVPASRQYRAPTPITFTLIGTCGYNKNPCEGLPPSEFPGPVTPDPVQPVTGPTVVLNEAPTPTRAAAPEIEVSAGDAVHLRLPWSPVGDRLQVSVLDQGRWVPLGPGVVAADGLALIPTFSASEPGDYLMRISDAVTGYVMVCVD